MGGFKEGPEKERTNEKPSAPLPLDNHEAWEKTPEEKARGRLYRALAQVEMELRSAQPKDLENKSMNSDEAKKYLKKVKKEIEGVNKKISAEDRKIAKDMGSFDNPSDNSIISLYFSDYTVRVNWQFVRVGDEWKISYWGWGMEE